jgi:hypothetical protein
MSTAGSKRLASRDAIASVSEPAKQKAQHEEITKATIERLARMPKGGADVYIDDTELPGFRLRRTPTNTIVFLFVDRVRWRRRKHKNKLIKQNTGKSSAARRPARVCT